MKSLKLLLVFFSFIMALSFSASAQNNRYVKTDKGKYAEVGKTTILTTTNATATHIDSIVIADNTAGIVTAEIVGAATNGDAVTGKQIFRYKKTAGTLTLGTAANILAIVADAGITGGTFAYNVTATNNLQIKVTGAAATTVRWRSTITQAIR